MPGFEGHRAIEGRRRGFGGEEAEPADDRGVGEDHDRFGGGTIAEGIRITEGKAMLQLRDFS